MRRLVLLGLLALPACVAVVQVDPDTEGCGGEVTVFTPVTGIASASECPDDS